MALRESLSDVLENGVSRTDRERLIDEWIFSERDRYILKRRLLDGVTYERLADEIAGIAQFESLSSRQIQNIVARGIQKLLKHLKIS